LYFACAIFLGWTPPVISNRSVPTDTVLPHVAYRNLEEAIVWLSNAFGFVEHYRYGNPISGAQMAAGNAWIMLKQARHSTPGELGFGTQSLTVFIEDLHAHLEQAKSAGVTLLEDLHETVYGELQYAAEDLDGHHWLFSRHARDLNPVQWGATVTHPAVLTPEISPMLAVGDANAAIEFYKTAFEAKVLWHLGGSEHVVRVSRFMVLDSSSPRSRPFTVRVVQPTQGLQLSESNSLWTIRRLCNATRSRRALFPRTR
jgi:uncharacterized glyoxalase superfamily protein PhnB